MKHSVQELFEVAYQYFPRGMVRGDPGHEQTPEVLRQKAARVPASARYEDWRIMLRRLRVRFPEEQFPGFMVNNLSLFLQVPTASDFDRCYTGELWLPVRSAKEKHHDLEFLVSFVVPYYTIRSECHLFNGRLTRKGNPDVDVETSFDLSPDELPFATAIEEEIRTTFPGHEPILPEVGLTVVPDVQAGNKWFGESTIFTCLFSDRW
jgi:hypothetical protein